MDSPFHCTRASGGPGWYFRCYRASLETSFCSRPIKRSEHVWAVAAQPGPVFGAAIAWIFFRQALTCFNCRIIILGRHLLGGADPPERGRRKRPQVTGRESCLASWLSRQATGLVFSQQGMSETFHLSRHTHPSLPSPPCGGTGFRTIAHRYGNAQTAPALGGCIRRVIRTVLGVSASCWQSSTPISGSQYADGSAARLHAADQLFHLQRASAAVVAGTLMPSPRGLIFLASRSRPSPPLSRKGVKCEIRSFSFSISGIIHFLHDWSTRAYPAVRRLLKILAKGIAYVMPLNKEVKTKSLPTPPP